MSLSLEEKSKQLAKAIVFLTKEYTKAELANIFCERNKLLPKSASSLTKYSSVYDTYTSEITEQTMDMYLETANDQMTEEFIMRFNQDSKEYEEIKLQFTEPLTRTQAERISSLSGVWVGYSWNRPDSKKSSEEKYNFYKLKIFSNGNICLSTENSPLHGRLHMIGTERIFIEMVHIVRRLYIVSTIDATTSLKNMNWISASYVDSGQKSSICGITYIKRVTEKYAFIKPGKYEEKVLPIKDEWVKGLKGTQHRVRTEEEVQEFYIKASAMNKKPSNI